MSKVYIIKAKRKTYKSWWDLGFCFTKEEAEKVCKSISRISTQSDISYYIVESEKEISGYNNGTGDIFISLTRSHKFSGDDGYENEVRVFNTRKEAYDYQLKRSKEDTSIWFTIDDIMKYDEYDFPKSSTYSNW